MALVGNWQFTAPDGQRDLRGGFDDLELQGFAGLSYRGLELGPGSWAKASYRQGPVLREKTLVCWVRMVMTGDEGGGGSVMSVAAASADHHPFDGLAFGDTSAFAWLAASSWNQRTHPELASVGDEDSAKSWGKLVKMAVTWRDLGEGRCEVSIYRQPMRAGQRRGPIELLQRFEHGTLVDYEAGEAVALFGPRYFSGTQPVGHVTCTVAAAQLWSEALSSDKIGRLRPPLARTITDEHGQESVEPAETFALIIGVQDYTFLDTSAGVAPGRSNLRGTLEDVRSYAALTRLMGVPAANMTVLTGPCLGPNDFNSIVMGRQRPVDMNMVDASFGYATEEGIRRGLRWLASQLRAHPGSQGLLFFAGHSVTTTEGHLALAPMDTRVRTGAAPAPGWPLPVDNEQAWWTWLVGVGLLKRLSGVLGTTDPDRILATISGALGSDDQASPARLGAALEAQGADLSEDATRTLARDLVAMSRNPDLAATLRQVRDLGLDPGQVASALAADPFAADAELEGLVSFMSAFNGELFPLPEDRALTVVLETCLPSTPERPMRSHYATNGLPLAHGNVAVLASCGLGQNSFSGVFDNRWHGAFTWALTSLLSQWDVVVSNAGRYFRQDYTYLLRKVPQLMIMMGFPEQQPAFWGQRWAREWPVFGRGEWEEQEFALDLLSRVKVKEEISPGGSGHIWVIADNLSGPVQPGNVLGWFISVAGTNPQKTIDGVTLTTNKDYWFWKNTAFPSNSFYLRRPPVGPGSDTLSGWIEANVSGTFTHKITYQQGQFQSHPGTPPAPSGAGHEVKVGSASRAYVKELAADPLGRLWYRISGGSMSEDRIELMAHDPVAPSTSQVVQFLWRTAPPSVTWVDQAVEDVPQNSS